ncbi:MAG: LysR family transcriptional regulator [Solirubrobacterales bacterium]|jgi:DNA-binding transcriptional LysR family regulator|nr:LysR family transcriptional regulator [Solirubrobacterales bacterium]
MLDVKRLRLLREVALRGSFSAAADELYLSQSAVSQQIATLEREVGMKLLDRTREGPKLTDAGRVLVSHADAAIARLEEAERELAAIAGLEGGELRLASFPSASATLLTEAVSIFHQRHPKVRLSIADAEPEESLPRLRGGELDLALSFDYPTVPATEDRDLDRTLVLTESMHVALPERHALAKRPIVPLAELADQRWLCGSRPSSCGEVVLRACRDAGFEPKVGFESDDYHVMQGFISAGLGFTLLPDLALPTLRDDLVVRPTDPPAPERRVWAATRAEGARSPATEEMVAILVEVGAGFAVRSRERLQLVA